MRWLAIKGHLCTGHCTLCRMLLTACSKDVLWALWPVLAFSLHDLWVTQFSCSFAAAAAEMEPMQVEDRVGQKLSQGRRYIRSLFRFFLCWSRARSQEVSKRLKKQALQLKLSGVRRLREPELRIFETEQHRLQTPGDIAHGEDFSQVAYSCLL